MSPRAACALAPLALLAGCAVLRIGVDVYKGPLANHEDVQVQQMAVMAVGAKPLLTQLRDTLQWPDPDCRRAVRGAEWYEDTYIPDKETDGGRSVLPVDDEQARRVNAVLSLYDDQRAPGTEEYLRAAGAAARRYANSFLVLESDPATDNAFWTEISKSMMPSGIASVARILGLPADAPTETLQNANQAFESLRRGYETFLRRPPGEPFRGPGAREAVAGYRDLLAAAGKRAAPKDTDELRGRAPATAAFAALADRRVVRAHAAVLFGDPDAPPAERFIDRVVTLAGAFLDAREAARDLWLRSLEYLHQVAQEPGVDAMVRARMVRALAELISRLTKVKDLATALSLYDKDLPRKIEYLRPKLTRLRDLLGENDHEAAAMAMWDLCDGQSCDYDTVWGRRNLDDNAKAIAELLVKSVAEAPELLLAADEAFRAMALVPTSAVTVPSGKIKVIKDGIPDSYVKEYWCDRDAFGRACDKAEQFGLVIGPVETELARQVKNLYGAVKLAAKAGGLERGRLPDGLYTLIENYIESSRDEAELTGPRGAAGKAREVLLEALVRFSEKVLFVANNERLLVQADEAGQRKTPHPLLEQIPVCKGQHAPPDSETTPQVLERYVTVLQAVGNAILVQADELEHRAQHASELEQRAGAEARALERALSRSGETIIDGLLDTVRRRKQVAEEESTAANAEITRYAILLGLDPASAADALTASAQVAVNNAAQTLAAKVADARQAVAAYRTVNGAFEELAPDLDRDAEFDGQGFMSADRKEIEAEVLQLSDSPDATAVLAVVEDWFKANAAASVGTKRHARASSRRRSSSKANRRPSRPMSGATALRRSTNRS